MTKYQNIQFEKHAELSTHEKWTLLNPSIHLQELCVVATTVV